MRRLVPSLAPALLGVAFAACGGGGGSGKNGGPAVDVVAFRADLEDPDVAGLYVGDTSGGVRRISGPDGTGDGTADFQWSPDRTLIAYSAETVDGGEDDLYVVDPEGGAPVLLAAPVGAGDVGTLKWSPDSSKILFEGDLDGDGHTSLYVVSASGGPSIPVSSPFVVPTYGTWAWSPDGTRVAYQAVPVGGGPTALCAAKADGTGIATLSGALVPGGNVQWMAGRDAWNVDSTHLLFWADKEVDGKFECYVVGADGSGLVKVSGSIVATSDVVEPRWSPDGLWVAYGLDDGSANRLRVVPKGGGTSQLVSAVGEDVRFFAWRPDSIGLAYVVNAPFADVLRLATAFAAPPVTLVGLGGGATEFEDSLAWSHDGSRLAYLAGTPGSGPDPDRFRLFVVPAAGGVPVPLTPSLTDDGYVADFEWSPDDARMAIRARVDLADHAEAFVAATDGSFSIQLSDAEGADSFVESVAWTSDGSAIVWWLGTDPGQSHLYVSGKDGTWTTPVLGSEPSFSDVYEMAAK
jgi:Tol biopolymer transport system component